MSRPILVVDLEATCWDDRTTTVDDMDIIEFGCVIADDSGNILDDFGTIVRPSLNPTLSAFCTQLTTITQTDVDSAPLYPNACRLIDEWLDGREKGLIWGSWGGYDLNQIRAEQARHAIAPKFLGCPHVNLKKLWAKSMGLRPMGMRRAIEHSGFSVNGTHHRGIDDARNISRLVPAISRDLINAAVHRARGNP